MENSGFLKSASKHLSGEAAFLMVGGGLLVLVGSASEWIHKLLVQDLGLSGSSTIARFAADNLRTAVPLGVGFFIGGLALYAARVFIDRFWKKYIRPAMDEHVSELSGALEKMRNDTYDLLSAAKLEQIVSRSSPEELKNQLRPIYSRVYGSHCESDRGLFAAVERTVGPYFDPKKPHRSDYQQTITIEDNADGTITWHEVTSYKLHTVSKDEDYSTIDEDDPGVPYTVTYGTGAKFPIANGKIALHLKVKVNDDIIFDSNEKLKIDEKNQIVVVGDNNGLTAEWAGDNLKIRVVRNITIDSKWVTVEIQESSRILDNYFVSRRNEPTCGAKINMRLPSGWAFDHIAFGDPDVWSIHQHPPNVLSASTSHWVLPGLMCAVMWVGCEKGEQPAR